MDDLHELTVLLGYEIVLQEIGKYLSERELQDIVENINAQYDVEYYRKIYQRASTDV